MKRISFIAAALLAVACGPAEPVDGLTFLQVDPMQKIYLEDSLFTAFDEVLPYAKGEVAAFQFALNSERAIENLTIEAGTLRKCFSAIEPAFAAFEEYADAAGAHRVPASDVAQFPASDMYPDRLNDVDSKNLPAGTNQPLWVSYNLPKDAKAGIYNGKVKVSGLMDGKPFEAVMPVSLEIMDVVLPEQTLMISNWHEHTDFHTMNNGEPVELFSDRYYELLTILVHSMRDHGQNSYFMYPFLDYVDCKLADGKYSFDFTNFDKVAEIFINEGDARLIEGGHLGGRLTEEWHSNFGVFLPETRQLAPHSSPEVQLFLDQFIPALYSHLQEKGWTDIYLQHVADEPYEPNEASYVDIAEHVKRLAPEMRIGDAILAPTFTDVVDLWVPLLNHFGTGYEMFRQRQAEGDELWFYTCVTPQGNYANRFYELPLIQMRILHWLNYKYGATGYLHWGYNQEWTFAAEGLGTNRVFPAGDCFITYPAYDKVQSSIRLETMLNGIHDYELLKMLEAKDPEAAKRIVDSVVYGFDSYNNDNAHFRKVRREMLEILQTI